MNLLQKSVLSIVGVAIIVGLYGGYKFLFSSTQTQVSIGSPAGTSFNTAKIAAIAVNLANTGANGTTTSLSNADASDRYVTSVEMGCEGVGTSQTAYSGTGLANLTLTVGTTSTSAPAAFPAGFNKVGGVSYNISTSTPNMLLSSTTGGVSTTSIIWGAGTNMTFFMNATNTALCSVGVKYIAS